MLDIEHPSTVVILLATNLVDDAQPLRLRIKSHGKLEKDSDLLIDQIRAIDNKRLTKGSLMICSKQFMKEVHMALLEVIGYRIEDT